MTARKEDINGFIEIKDNPITKVGVFQYAGRQLDPKGRNPSVDPNKIYNVYRPEEELTDPACIESFRLLPITNEHTLLGNSSAGLTPAEQKGVEGTIGEDIKFENGYLKANLKIFSERLAKLIESGKKELSIGYRCMYEYVSGMYNGMAYDVIQRNLRGNHLAVVREGRSGAEVAVLDHFTFTLDSAEFNKMGETEKTGEMKKTADQEGALTLESLAEKIEALANRIEELAKPAADADKTGEMKKTVDAGKDGEMKKTEVAKDVEEKTAAMDARLKAVTTELNEFKINGTKKLLAELSKRDALAREVSYQIGAFDHADKTLDEVAIYALDKLGLKAEQGQEHAVLAGYLAGYKAQNSGNTAGVAMDGAQKSSVQSDTITKYLEEGK